MKNIILRFKCDKCGKIFTARDLSEKQYKIGDNAPCSCCGNVKVWSIEELCNPEDCKDGGSLYPSKQLYGRNTMTDKEIGKTAREIAERGNTAEVKRNKDGIVILEVGKKIVRKDNVSADKEL